MVDIISRLGAGYKLGQEIAVRWPSGRRFSSSRFRLLWIRLRVIRWLDHG
jgi:hypothetical protein